MTHVVLFAGGFFVVSVVTVFAACRRLREVEPLFPLFEETRRLSGGAVPLRVVTSRGVNIALDSLHGVDLLEATRWLAEIDRLPETSDLTETLAW